MARMPGAEWAGEHGSSPMSRYDIVCIHTIVGYAPAHAAHFSTHADGRIVQSIDTAYQSAANLNGNPRVIAIENEDHGDAFGAWKSSDNAPPLTDAQIDACARILRWAHETHGIPLQLCPDSRPGSRGLAYHRQGIDGNFGTFAFPGRVSGGEVWTLSPGKVCPTDNRIGQLPEILRRARGDAPDPKPNEEDELNADEKKKLDSIEADVAKMRPEVNQIKRALMISDKPGKQDPMPVPGYSIFNEIQDIKRDVAEALRIVKGLKK